MADAREFEKIRRHVRRLIAAMGEDLYHGNVAPNPCDGAGGKTCEYCDYAALCHADRLGQFPGNPEINIADFYALLDKEEKEGAE